MAVQKEKVARLRSPAYPAIDLPKAIELAEKFKGYAGRSAVTVSHVLEHWGFKGASSNGMKIIAALGYYGLIHDTGTGDKRKIQLTERAWRIVVDHEESDARAQAILDAALSPKIFKELWEEWGSDLPPEAEIRSHLIFEKKFNERAVSGLIADYKTTLDYAGLLEPGMILEPIQESSGDEMAATPSDIRPNLQKARMPQVKGAKNIEIPIPSTPWPILTTTVPMSEDRWKMMMDMLNAMKPALVSGDDAEESGGE